MKRGAKIKRIKYSQVISKAEWRKLKQTRGFTDLLTESTGRDNIPNQPDCHSLKDFSSNSVADHAFLVLLPGLFKNLGYRFELKDKTALVIGGAGAIGSKVVQRSQGFGMKAIAFDTFFNNDTDKLLLTILKRADLISLCVPLTPETKSYFKARHYKAMQKCPLILNVSGRNGLLEPNLLGRFLLIKKVRGYACDGFLKHWIAQLPQTFFCVHSGARTIEADIRKKQAIERKLAEISQSRANQPKR